MSAFQPFAVPVDLASAEDAMDFFADSDNRPSVDDGVDIDLDLTTDPPQNTDDDEMIEDLEAGMEQAEYLDVEPGHDEQMVDEIGEDDGILHDVIEDAYEDRDEELDDIDFEEHNDELDVSANVVEHLPQLDQGKLDNTSQDITQKATQSYSHFDFQAHNDARPGTQSAPEISQGLLGQDQIHEEPVIHNSSLPTIDGQSARRSVSVEETYVNQDKAEEFTHISRSPMTEAALGSQRQQDILEEPQLDYPEYRSDPNHTGFLSMKEPDAFSENTDKVEDVAAGASSVDGNHDLISFNKYASPQHKSTSAHSPREESSTSTETNQDHGKLLSNSVSHEAHQEPDAAIVSQTNLEQEFDMSQDSPYIHSVVVTYQESEMFLFPPAAEEQDDNQTYFLDNEALAAEPIHSLLKECRNVLEGSISEKEELELDIDNLGLRICESTVDAATISLTRILDVYLQLHYQDGNDSPPPMNMTLSTNIRFSHRLAYLTGFVAEGKGISQLESEDLSIHSGLSEEMQETETGGTVGESAVDLNAGDADESLTSQTHSQHGLFVEDSTAQVPAKGFHNDANPSSSGGEQPNANSVATAMKTLPSNAASLIDGTYLVNGEGSSTANSTLSAPSHAPQGKEDSPEDHYDQEEEEEEARAEEHVEEYDDDLDYEENNEKNEDSSAGSSTIQGDDAGTVSKEAGVSKGTTASDGDLVSAEQFLSDMPKGNPEDEDFITYESDEENGNLGDSSSTNVGERETADAELLTAETVTPVVSGGALSHDPSRNDQNVSGVSPEEDLHARNVDGNELEPQRVDPDRIRDESRPQGENREDQAFESRFYDQTNQPGTLNDSRTLGAHQILDQNSTTLNGFKSGYAGSETAQHRVQSVEDEDEITFDDEIEEEAETEDLADAPTDFGIEQASSSSPGVLKRPRPTDEENHLLAADAKRVRS